MKHKHCELIKAWADGAEIQCKQVVSSTWRTMTHPNWDAWAEYRIKPKTVKYRLYLYRRYENEVALHISCDPTLMGSYEDSPNFVKWIDDWQEVEV